MAHISSLEVEPCLFPSSHGKVDQGCDATQPEVAIVTIVPKNATTTSLYDNPELPLKPLKLTDRSVRLTTKAFTDSVLVFPAFLLPSMSRVLL